MELPDDEDDGVAIGTNPGSPRNSDARPRGFDRNTSPTLRVQHPKARRNILVDTSVDAEVGEHFSAGSAAFGRGSPNPFLPIRGGGSSLGADDEGYSMAGARRRQCHRIKI